MSKCRKVEMLKVESSPTLRRFNVPTFRLSEIPQLYGFQHCPVPISHPELLQDVVHVVLDGAFDDAERFADFTVREARREKAQDLPLARRQRLRHFRRLERAGRFGETADRA